MEPDVRDTVVETMREYQERTGIEMRALLRFAGISASTLYEWQRRYGIPNRHNGKVPKSHYLLEEEKQGTVSYDKKERDDG